MSKRIHFRLKYRRRNYAGAILLKEYAKQKHVVTETVRLWIAERKVAAFKAKGRWYITPEIWP